MKYAILTPTRSRPEKMRRHLQSISDTISTTSDVCVYVFVDSDDPDILKYRDLESEQFNIPTVFLYDDVHSIGVAWNIMAKLAINDGADWIVMGNDDIVYKTSDWDIKLDTRVGSLSDAYHVLWVDDGINQERWCAFPMVSKEWYTHLGYFVPEIFIFGCHDAWVFEVAKHINRCVYVPEVLNHHLHHSKHSSESDKTTTLDHLNTGTRSGIFARDIRTLESKRAEIIADANNIQEKIDSV